jgi:septal ring factor EnvC (AmiA/AmiB activator)
MKPGKRASARQRRAGGSGKRHTAARRWLTGIALAASLSPLPASRAQEAPVRLEDHREELEALRRERADLERRMSQFRGTVHELSEEVANIDRQAGATARLVRALDRQLAQIGMEIANATEELRGTETELERKRSTLRRRVRDIYKRGPMYEREALLAAQSFGDLVTRYKYLHELARRDRALMHRVEQLRNDAVRQRTILVGLQATVEETRRERAHEEGRLRALERQRSASLASVERAAAVTAARIAEIRRDEAALGRVIASAVEAERRRAARTAAGGRSRRAAPRPADGMRASDAGRLDWPVDGSFLYDFGREQRSNNTAVRWNGIGIRASAGTPVLAVAAGRVLEVSRFGTYGLTVIVEHGGGDYSIYGSLGRAEVVKGASVAKGQTLGTVGISDPELGPHLHFEIRQGGPAVDPKIWLRQQR